MNNLFSILLILFVVLFSLIFIIERFSKPISEAQTSKISSWIMSFTIYFNCNSNNSSLFLLKENFKKNIINIFLVRLSKLDDDYLYFLKNALTNDELTRFENHKSDKNRLISIVSRGLFRTQFSRFLNLPLSDIRYIKKYKTKPELFIESKNRFTDLDFNLSHVEDWVILAISPFQIGIDVEYVFAE